MSPKGNKNKNTLKQLFCRVTVYIDIRNFLYNNIVKIGGYYYDFQI